MPEIRFRPGLCPRPRWGSSWRSPRPPSRLGRGKPPPHSPTPSTPTASRSRCPEFHFPKVGNPIACEMEKFQGIENLIKQQVQVPVRTTRRPFVHSYWWPVPWSRIKQNKQYERCELQLISCHDQEEMVHHCASAHFSWHVLISRVCVFIWLLLVVRLGCWLCMHCYSVDICEYHYLLSCVMGVLMINVSKSVHAELLRTQNCQSSATAQFCVCFVVMPAACHPCRLRITDNGALVATLRTLYRALQTVVLLLLLYYYAVCYYAFVTFDFVSPLSTSCFIYTNAVWSVDRTVRAQRHAGNAACSTLFFYSPGIAACAESSFR